MKVVLGVAGPIALTIAFFVLVVRPPIPDAPEPPTLGDTTDTDAPQSPPDGLWELDSQSSWVGYRIVERDPSRLGSNEAVGRTSVVSGRLSVSDGVVTDAEVVADLSRLSSDQPRRDTAIRVRYLESNDHPKAAFALREPIALAAGLADGHTLTHQLAGTIDIRDVVRPVVAEVQARWDGNAVVVAGSVPIALADHGVRAPRILGFRMVEDRAEIELQLRWVLVAE